MQETTQTIKTDSAEVLLSLEQLIKNHVSSIDALKEELRKHNQMLKDACENDAVYQEHDRLAKEAAKVRAATKMQIMKQAANASLASKVKGMRTELKDKQLALSDYLLEYQRQTGVNQLELFTGEVLDIVQTAKVVRTRKAKN